MLTSAILKRCSRLLPTDWRILQWSKETDETVVASYGSVEVRQTPQGCLAQTLVKGEMDVARGTALVRLAKYVGGHNQRAVSLEAERPILQQQKAPGLWLVALRLVAVDDVCAAPVPRTNKVRIVAQEPTTWAVITRAGPPNEHAIARAEAAVMDALDRTHWFAAGPSVVRIYAPGSIIRFWGSFQLAIPVYRQPTERAHVAEPTQTSRPANWSSQPVH